MIPPGWILGAAEAPAGRQPLDVVRDGAQPLLEWFFIMLPAGLAIGVVLFSVVKGFRFVVFLMDRSGIEAGYVNARLQEERDEADRIERRQAALEIRERQDGEFQRERAFDADSAKGWGDNYRAYGTHRGL